MRKLFVQFVKNESAASAIEYGLIATGISLAIIAVVSGLGTTLNGTFTNLKLSFAKLLLAPFFSGSNFISTVLRVADSSPHLKLGSVASNPSLATKAAPHQFDIKPVGLTADIAPGPPNVAVWSSVNTLQFAFERSVS
jgi:pilus assembly protein Flp/PilA